jgi:hypothetical protein
LYPSVYSRADLRKMQREREREREREELYKKCSWNKLIPEIA